MALDLDSISLWKEVEECIVLDFRRTPTVTPQAKEEVKLIVSRFLL